MKAQTTNRADTLLNPRVLVVGDTLAARFVVHELTSMGHEVIWTNETKLDTDAVDVDPDDSIPKEVARRLAAPIDRDMTEVIAPARIVEFEGEPGSFSVVLDPQGERMNREVGGAVVATGVEKGSPLEEWGLEASDRIWTLSAFAAAVESGPGIPMLQKTEHPTVVFVCGFTHHSHPVTQRTAFQCARWLAANLTGRVLFLTEHFKVADTGMERLSREAREAGVLFVKWIGDRPRVQMDGADVLISYPDESLGDRVCVYPDLVVLEEPVKPPGEGSSLAAALGVDLDPMGFFQGDTIYNLPIFTNRTGIWVVGSAKGPASFLQGFTEASAAAMEASKLLGGEQPYLGESRVQLDPRRCAICLTCFRVCPHRAISYVNRRPVFSHLACKACGMCEAECPMGAITLEGSVKTAASVWNPDSDAVSTGSSTEETLPVVAFCCENSALQAARFARMLSSIPDVVEVRPVPCGANVDVEMLLGAFQSGAQVVMVLVCHHDSCKSVAGSHMAEWRVESLRESLEEMGISRERLVFGTMAPGMPRDFLRIAQQVAETCQGLTAAESSEEGTSQQQGEVHE